LGEIFINQYETLIDNLYNENIEVITKKFKSSAKGLCKRGKITKIGINKGIATNAERYCVLKEEQGHIKLTVGDIKDQSNINNRKQEKKARTWAYLDTIKVVDLINAYGAGVRNLYEMAEYLEVTEEFLNETIKTMGEKYGPYYEIDNYIVYFTPNFGIFIMGGL
jgi:hypothetical protein